MDTAFVSNEKIEALLDESRVDQFGDEMFALCKELWPLNRSLTGEGNRKTLEILKRELPSLQLREVPSGTQVFDWVVPREWVVREAWIRSPDGKKICDFSQNNLSLVGYSTAVDCEMSLEDLQGHLYSLPEQPDAVPYVTSYYSDHWGFCLSETDRANLEPGTYTVFIDSEHLEGSMSYGELLLPGLEKSEILLSTYICHPSMANNELSGIAVSWAIAKWLAQHRNLRHSYRILFLPETIGPITYLSQHLAELQKSVVAGYVLTCVGDDRAFSFVPTRHGNTLADRVAMHVLKQMDPGFQFYSWFDRQSDERQYGAPGVDLPIASMMRSKYGSFPEYHTSKDTLGEVVTPAGLVGALRAYQNAIRVLELDCYPITTTIGEPNLGRRGLYPSVSTKNTLAKVKLVRDLISMSDGHHSLLEIAEMIGTDFVTAYRLVARLVQVDLLRVSSRASN